MSFFCVCSGVWVRSVSAAFGADVGSGCLRQGWLTRQVFHPVLDMPGPSHPWRLFPPYGPKRDERRVGAQPKGPHPI